MDSPYIQVLLDYTPPWRAQLGKWRKKMAECGSKKEEPGPDISQFMCLENSFTFHIWNVRQRRCD